MSIDTTALAMPLRPYQVEARRAVLASVHAQAGRTFTIEAARTSSPRTSSWSCSCAIEATL